MRERKRTIGPVKHYPEGSKKLQDLLAGLRLKIDTDGPTELTSVTMAAAVEHYKEHELAGCRDGGKAYSTCQKKTLVLNQWILPNWGKLDLRAIKTVAVEKRASWHTFRHTFSTLLKANGEDVKVAQELLRHASAKMTLDTYSQALTPPKRAAQSKVVSMIRPKSTCTVDVPRVFDRIGVSR